MSRMLEFDRLYQLAYMSALATSKITSGQIIDRGANLQSEAARDFGRAREISKGMGYDLAESCRIVGERSKTESTRSLFLRLSSSIASGEPIGQFLDQEFGVQSEVYTNSYERQLESVRKWTDSYAALMVSSSLIVIVAAISTMIYSLGSAFVAGLVTVTVTIGAVGAWIIYRSAPEEARTLKGQLMSDTQRMHRLLLWALGGLGVVVGCVIIASGHSPGLAMMVLALLLLPVGIAGMRYDAAVTRRDEELGTFFRVLGSTASSIGTTPAEAIARIDLRSLPSLAHAIARLQLGLRARTAIQEVWNRFVTDTGSELALRSVRIFREGTGMGGDAGEVGERTAGLSAQINFMRAKRRAIATTFAWLSIVLHLTVVFLLFFVLAIVSAFSDKVSVLSSSVQSQAASINPAQMLNFNFANLHELQLLMIPVALVLSVINALAAKVADGGYQYKYFFYLSATLFLAGLAIVGAPTLANAIFRVAGQ